MAPGGAGGRQLDPALAAWLLDGALQLLLELLDRPHARAPVPSRRGRESRQVDASDRRRRPARESSNEERMAPAFFAAQPHMVQSTAEENNRFVARYYCVRVE